MKKVYFVRHGESEFNAQKLHQHSDVKLSPHGITQAAKVARRFSDVPVEIILASDSLRAADTANIIAKDIRKEVAYTPLLKEIRRPSEIVGKHQDDPFAKEVRERMKQYFAQPDWHYSDEENFFDAKKRGEAFLEFLLSRKEECILVVTHGVFTKIIIGLMMTQGELTPQLFLLLREFFATRNTGITLCDQDLDGRWHLITWNDHAHL